MKGIKERDSVVPGLDVKQDKIVLRMDELYKVMKDWSKLNRYKFIEKLVEREGTSAEGKEDTLMWVFERKVDEYTKFVIRSVIKITGRDVNIKKKGKALKGGCSIRVDSWLERDYEREWEVIPILKFLRGFYDKFILESKTEKYMEKLRNETHDFYNEVKAFLDLHTAG